MKKASLQLSVNAIVILVLAFLMLSVGIFFTNFLKDQLKEGGTKVIDFSDLKMPPSSDRPIVFPDEITLPKAKSINLEVGFYNTQNVVAEDARVGVLECTNTDPETCNHWAEGDPITELIKVSSPKSSVDPSSGKGYKITFRAGDGADAGCTYICRLVVYNSNNDNDIYAEHQFFLIIAS